MSHKLGSVEKLKKYLINDGGSIYTAILSVQIVECLTAATVNGGVVGLALHTGLLKEGTTHVVWQGVRISVTTGLILR